MWKFISVLAMVLALLKNNYYSCYAITTLLHIHQLISGSDQERNHIDS